MNGWMNDLDKDTNEPRYEDTDGKEVRKHEVGLPGAEVPAGKLRERRQEGWPNSR